MLNATPKEENYNIDQSSQALPKGQTLLQDVFIPFGKNTECK